MLLRQWKREAKLRSCKTVFSNITENFLFVVCAWPGYSAQCLDSCVIYCSRQWPCLRGSAPSNRLRFFLCRRMYTLPFSGFFRDWFDLQQSELKPVDFLFTYVSCGAAEKDRNCVAFNFIVIFPTYH